ncbi:MAG: FliM/FliN family flagellar motor switch protein [Acidobacteriaceae bacterium]
MASNRRVLDLWIEVVCAELEELLRVPVKAQATEDIPQAASAYRSQLLFEGPVHGVMYVTASAASMVQLAQMVAGEPVDPHAAWTEEGLEAWQIWLTAASGKLAARLSEEFPEASQGPCGILLRETTAVEGVHLASGPETAASGAAVQEWLLRAGEGEIALSVSVQAKFLGEELPVSEADASQAASASAGQEGEEEMEDPDQEIEADISLPAAAPNPPAAGPVFQHVQEDRNELHDGERQPAPRQTEDPRAPESNPPSSKPGNGPRLDLLLDIELEATLRFGALELPLREVLELGPGDVLPLDRHVREPVDLVVGDRIVARGEVVLVEGNFALHVTEVAEPRRRLETIRCLF